jgi:hypothetical protein
MVERGSSRRRYLYRTAGDLTEAHQALAAGAALDLGDHFRFTIGPAQPLAQGARHYESRSPPTSDQPRSQASTLTSSRTSR